MTLNGPLRFYLADLVGNARELVITADNAKIPIESPEHSVFGDDISMYSNYTHYSHMDGSCSSSAISSMNSSMNSSSSRWDSEASPSPTKEQRPRLPPRRCNSGSPPPSPIVKPHVARRSVSDDAPYLDCCVSSSSSSSNKPICLATAAAEGMLRMPKRRDSITKTTRRQRQRSQHTQVINSGKHSRNAKEVATRNVSDILGEAIRELGLTENELTSSCADPSLVLHSAQEMHLKPKFLQ